MVAKVADVLQVCEMFPHDNHQSQEYPAPPVPSRWPPCTDGTDGTDGTRMEYLGVTLSSNLMLQVTL